MQSPLVNPEREAAERCSSMIVARGRVRRAGKAQVAGAGCTRDPWRRAESATRPPPRHVVTPDRMIFRSPEQGPECIPLPRPPRRARTRINDHALSIRRRRAHVPSMTTRIETEPRQLGAAGPTVFPLALGCMGMSGHVRHERRSREHRHDSRRARRAASRCSIPATSTGPGTTRC